MKCLSEVRERALCAHMAVLYLVYVHMYLCMRLQWLEVRMAVVKVRRMLRFVAQTGALTVQLRQMRKLQFR